MPNKKWWIAGLLLAAAIIGAFVVYYRPTAEAKKASARDEPWNDFSGEKAFAHVQALVDLGPRPAPSKALDQARAYITGELKKCGWNVEEQAFQDATPRGKVRFV